MSASACLRGCGLASKQVYELSDVAEEFLRAQFSTYDLDGDGLISWQQLDAMFSTIPPPMWQGEEWSRLLVPGVYGATHHLEAFLLKWRYSVLQCPRTALAHLLYLGAGGPEGSDAGLLLQQRTRRKADKKHRAELATRSSLQCYVFGARGSGKSTLIHALPGLRPSPADLQPPSLTAFSTDATTLRDLTAAASQTSPSKAKADSAAAAAAGGTRDDEAVGVSAGSRGSGPFAAVAPVRGPMGGRERTLVMQEISEDLEQQLLTTAAMTKDFGAPLLVTPPRDMLDSKASVDLAKADVAAFVFDASSAESFRAAVNLMVQVSTLAGDSLPCVLVAAKEDLVMGAQLEKELAAVMAELQVRGPVRCSALLGELGGVFGTLAVAAVCPEGWVPETPDRKARRQLVHQVATVACVCGVALASCGALYATYRLLRPSSSSSSSSTSTAGNTSSRLSSSVNSTREGASNSSSSSGGENGGSVLLNLTEYAGSALSRLPVILGGLVGASSSREDSHSNNSSSSGGGQSGHGEGGQQGGGGAGLGAFLPSLRAHSVAEGPCSCYSAGPGTGLFNRPPPAASVPHASYPLCIAGGEALGVWPMLPEPVFALFGGSRAGCVADAGGTECGGKAAAARVPPFVHAFPVQEGPAGRVHGASCGAARSFGSSTTSCSESGSRSCLGCGRDSFSGCDSRGDSLHDCSGRSGGSGGSPSSSGGDSGRGSSSCGGGSVSDGLGLLLQGTGATSDSCTPPGLSRPPHFSQPFSTGLAGLTTTATATAYGSGAASCYTSCSYTFCDAPQAQPHTDVAVEEHTSHPTSSMSTASTALPRPASATRHQPCAHSAPAPAVHPSSALPASAAGHQPCTHPAPAPAPALHSSLAPLCPTTHHQPDICQGFIAPSRSHACAYHQPTSTSPSPSPSIPPGSVGLSHTCSTCRGGSPLPSFPLGNVGSSHTCVASRDASPLPSFPPGDVRSSHTCVAGRDAPLDAIGHTGTASKDVSLGATNRTCSTSRGSPLGATGHTDAGGSCNSRYSSGSCGMSGSICCSSPYSNRGSSTGTGSSSSSSSAGSNCVALRSCREPYEDPQAVMLPSSQRCAAAAAAAPAAANVAGTSSAAAAVELVWLAVALGRLGVLRARRRGGRWLHEQLRISQQQQQQQHHSFATR
mmetsp:Transcript_28820/g.74374  ORF Transcript_28820/g.74374 Transcript_28820/m.74374 type:complete len:1156 (+) Transcript_28820:366-3833(+)